MEPLAPAIMRFAARYLLSREDLRVLVLSVDEPDRWHDADAVAEKLEIPRGTARTTLDHLARNNLLDIRITGDIRYRFRPGNLDLERQALSAVEAYRKTPARILELIGR
jgi:hypothetical protein